jgi:MATE family multidrug resistance protein
VAAATRAVGLAFGLGWGPLGLWWGLSAGLAFAGVGMLLRFAWGTR